MFWFKSNTTFPEDSCAGLHSASGRSSDCRTRGRKFDSQLGHITSVANDHEIISMVILPLSPIQEGQLSVTGICVCTKVLNPIED